MLLPGNIKLIVFDWNGTLVNDIPYHMEAYRIVLKDFGIDAKNEELKRIIGRSSTTEVIEYFERKYNIRVDFDVIRERKIKKYLEVIKGKALFFPNELKILQRLAKRYVLAMFTGSNKKQLTKVIPNNVKSLFKVIVSDDDVKNKKPDPEGLFMILRAVNVESNHACFVGDTARDMLTAKNAAMHAVGVLSGVDDGGKLREAGAEIIFKNVVEFGEYMLKS
ncbi:MAG TPA: HAD family hydrolase [Candidatus Aenigmarchaeota archaeon]|nr:HAD family hydrolase [Candidatus Aenigmarchaeota archaeon]